MKHAESARIVMYALIALVCATLAVMAQSPKLNWAVVAIKNGEGVTTGEVEIIADRLRGELFKTGKASMMERDQMQEILKEQGFQASGACTDEACMVEIGQLLGVERLVSGSMGRLGSMFLINMRAIDVETAKIVKVVSVDIRGEIEDVVEHLANIAQELVGAEVSSAPSPKAEARKKAEPEAEKEPEEEKEPEVAETPKVVDGAKEEKNKNRAGIRLCFVLYPGSPTHSIDGEEFDIASSWENASNVPLMSYQVKFIIKAGRFFTVDIGPGFSFASESFSEAYDYYGSVRGSDFSYVIPAACLGFNFTWRFFPLKVNVGPVVDLNFPIEIWKPYINDLYWGDGDSTSTSPEVNAAFKVAVGGRAGVEILAGSHAGFAFDAIIRPFSYEVDWEDEIIDIYGYYETITTTHEVRFPFFGLGFSANFYF